MSKKIAITLNEVVRNFKGNFMKVHENYMESLNSVEYLKDEMPNDESEFGDNALGFDSSQIQQGEISNERFDLSATPLDIENADDFILNPMEEEEERVLLNLPESDDIEGISKDCKFIDKEDYNGFIYEDMAFELFGKTSQSYVNAVHHLNKLYQMMVDAGHSVSIVSQERKSSIPATHLFLAQNNFRCNNTKFVYDYSQIWNSYDLIITANSYIINSKPSNKLCFKIQSEYNGQSKEADMQFQNLGEVIDFWIEKTKSDNYEA